MNASRAARNVRWVCRSCQTKALSRPAPFQSRRQSTAPSATSAAGRQWSTPLAKTIGEAIQTTGPISIAQYMRQCLTSPEGGYYTTQSEDRDQFGQKGDFITSPEISQVFGELLGLWFVTEWMAQGRQKSGIELVEVGPGRGTLMDDMLRAIRSFKAFASGIESVYMVEASPGLREKQRELLCGDVPMQETDIGWRSASKYGDIPVTWCEDIRFVPSTPDKTPFIVAHEFFDALPIHAFTAVAPTAGKQGGGSSDSSSNSSSIIGLDGKPIELKTPPPPPSSPLPSTAKAHQWRELMVSIAAPPKAHTSSHKPYANVSNASAPDFELIRAQAANPASLVMPEMSARYKALKSMSDAVIEVSPESHSYAGEFARRIGGPNPGSAKAATSPSSAMAPKPTPSGAALILDYGTLDTVPTSTLRGIRSHELVGPFTTPGLTDLSADVDFTALAEAAIDASPRVEVHGPVEQGVFLESMGIRERCKILEKKARKGGDAAGEEAAKRISSAVERLVERSGGGMGRIYKALAIIPENGGRRRPVGFGGQVM